MAEARGDLAYGHRAAALLCNSGIEFTRLTSEQQIALAATLAALRAAPRCPLTPRRKEPKVRPHDAPPPHPRPRQRVAVGPALCAPYGTHWAAMIVADDVALLTPSTLAGLTFVRATRGNAGQEATAYLGFSAPAN